MKTFAERRSGAGLGAAPTIALHAAAAAALLAYEPARISLAAAAPIMVDWIAPPAPPKPGTAGAPAEAQAGGEAARHSEPARAAHCKRGASGRTRSCAGASCSGAEYYVGNRFVSVERSDANPITTLVRLHQAIGVNALWVLVADTIAGSRCCSQPPASSYGAACSGGA